MQLSCVFRLKVRKIFISTSSVPGVRDHGSAPAAGRSTSPMVMIDDKDRMKVHAAAGVEGNFEVGTWSLTRHARRSDCRVESSGGLHVWTSAERTGRHTTWTASDTSMPVRRLQLPILYRSDLASGGCTAGSGRSDSARPNVGSGSRLCENGSKHIDELPADAIDRPAIG